MDEKLSALSKDVQSSVEQAKSVAQDAVQTASQALSAFRTEVDAKQANTDLKIQSIPHIYTQITF
jgi:hypothetical protein